jgi:polyisoprenyl-teichoic acid--peptidoglycan teichoic acid transferase
MQLREVWCASVGFMNPIRAAWSRLTTPQRALAFVPPLVLVGALAIGAALAFGQTPAAAVIAAGQPSQAPSAAVTVPPLPPDPTLAPDASILPSATPAPPGADPLLGTDGRLTVLLLGSDYRPAHPGNRTDAIMVVSLDPTTGKAAAFSIPRDTSGFPLANGKTFGPKINALFQHLQSTTGNGGRAMSQAVAKAFDIEVDGYVFIGFAGVKNLVAAVGGVDVTLDQAYYDAHYWVNAHTQGWGLPKGTSHLSPNDALIFARSRKGDNDFGRARRQQLLVMAALDKARSLGIAKLPRLLQIARQTVRTNLPLDRAADLFHLLATTDLSKVERVVFGPTTYATATGGSAFELDIKVDRRWIRDHFPVIRPMGQWPAAVRTPSTAP